MTAVIDHLLHIATIILLLVGLRWLNVNVKRGFKIMADDFTGLEKAQEDNAAATTAAIDELKVLFAQVAQTPPSNQAEIDALTAKFNASTDALKAGIVAPTA